MGNIIVRYDSVDAVVGDIDSIKSSLDNKMSDYTNLIKNLINFTDDEWKGLEKGAIVKCASGTYHSYFSKMIENVVDARNQIKNKEKRFSKAELEK